MKPDISPMIEPLDKSYMVVEQNSLENITKNPELEFDGSFEEIFADAIDRTNKIVVHTYNFLKLYYLYLFSQDKNFPIRITFYPKLDVQLIRIIMNTIIRKVETRGKPA